MKLQRYITILCLLALTIGVAYTTACQKRRSTEDDPIVEEKTVAKEPDAPQNAPKGPTYKNLVDGQDISLEAFKGHVLLINFWTTWCMPCRMEIPEFIQLYDKYKDQKFAIIGISLDYGEAVAKRFVDSQKMNYPVIMYTKKLLIDYGRAIGRPIQGLPTTILVNRAGEIVSVNVGLPRKPGGGIMGPKELYEEKIQDLLNAS
jgi:thiol-disulfide isomerase/thioredoxin